MKTTSYDLIVVGSSFASTFFLKKYLSKAPLTVRVLVLERGHKFPYSERIKEKRGIPTPFAQLNEDSTQTYINKNPEKKWEFQTAFGGSSNCWSGCTPRFLPSDFKLKTLYGVANDWPVQYEDLDPYYTETEEIMSISGPDNTPYPKKSPYPLPPHAFTTVDKILHEKYGNLYISPPTARASKPINGRGQCCVSGVCRVCPVNAKFTIENSNMGVYEDERVELITGAQVLNLELVQNVARQVCFIKEGKEFKASAEIIALGANPIFNAHILLNSGDKNPLTGRGIGEQLGLIATVHLKDLPNLGGSSLLSANGYMLYDGPHRKEHAACLMESNTSSYVRIEKGKWRNLISFRMIFEDLPDEQNYVSLSKDDPYKPEVHFKGNSEYTSKGIERMKEKLPEILSCLPVEEIYYRKPFSTEAHIIGTTRMSQTPEEGVVDKNLIHHHYRNLLVLGSGSFTTYSPANPTLTLSALSLYAADHL